MSTENMARAAARKTKIVATLGPASEPRDVLVRLIVAGVDVVRLNLSHSTVEAHLENLAVIREISEEVGRPVGVLADLPGPKVRSGVFPEGGAFLAEGSEIHLVPGDGDDMCTAGRLVVDYPSLLTDLRIGDAVILGDGAITMRVERLTDDAAVARVETGGRVQGRPGVHIPSERMRLTAPTDEDLELLRHLVPAEVDFVAVSFVRSGADLDKVRDFVASLDAGPCPMLVAKIETAPAIANLDGILAATDAVMVARGDLGIECPLEDVPHVQKQVIRACVMAGVPVITATQMLESMIQSPAPTRAEVSDVANAVFDGTDAVMLSAETAIGADPVNVVTTMGRIAERAERDCDYVQWAGRLSKRLAADDLHDVTSAMTHAAWQASIDGAAAAILCCTRSGATARAMARFRPPAQLVSLSPSVRTCRQMCLSWGITPYGVDTYRSTDEMVWFAVETAVKHGIAQPGELVAVLAGAPDSTDGHTDVLRLVRLT
jgi:pyruvate kinase